MRNPFWICACLVLFLGGKSPAAIPVPEDAPQPMSPEESKRCFQLPDGFRIDLIASEPLIRDPSCVAWDERGRLFVTEIHGYNLEGHLDVTELNKTGKLDTSIRRIRVGPEMKEEARRGQTGALKLLKDSDGDGRMDKVIVWADDIPAAYGVVPARGGVIVTAEPHIYFFADTDGDDRPDVRERLFSGFERGEMERAINNPVWGPDNWIYAGRGWGGATVSGPNLEGTVQLGRNDFRFKPDGSAIEPVSGDNHTFGMSFDDFGFRYLITTGQPVRYAAPLPYRYLARNPHVPSPETTVGASPYHNTFPISEPHPWRRKRGADPRWVKFYGAGEAKPNGNFTSACGQQVYRACLFPEEYHGNHFACEPQQNLVHRSIVSRDGPGLRARRPDELADREFLSSSDGWFRPNNLRVGPDGALYVVDMYREIIEDYSAIPRYLQQQYGLLHGNDRGRIWRLAPVESESAPVDTEGVAAVASLRHPNAWWRETAQRLLVERPSPEQTASLRGLAVERRAPWQARLHALYTLDGRGELRARDVARAMHDPHPAVRMHDLRLGERFLQASPEILDAALRLIDEEEDESVLLQLALSLGESKSPRAVAGLAHLAGEMSEVRWMEAAVLSSIASTADRFLDILLREHPDAAVALVERATQTALRSKTGAGPGLLAALAAHPDEALRLRLLALAAQHGFEDTPELRAVAAAAMETAADQAASHEKRLAALRLAPYAPADSLQQTLSRLTDPTGNPAFQEQALRELLGTDNSGVASAVISRIPSLTPRAVAVVIESLLAHTATTRLLLNSGGVTPASFSTLQRHRLLHHADAEIKKLASSFLTEARSTRERTEFAGHFAALGKDADPKRGAAVFANHCATCHQFGEEGFAVGPPLDGESGRPGESLLADILDPAQTLTAGYSTFLAKTKSGGSYAGILSSETATSLTLTQAGGVQSVVLRDELASVEKLDLSLMPVTFADVLSPQESADLVAFLKSKPPPASIVLFDDDPAFPGLLGDGRGQARLDWRDAASGNACLTVSGFQRYSRHLPGWKFAIREEPAVGEFRYLRVSMMTRRSEGMMLELADDGSFPPESRPIRTYYAGRNLTGWKSNQLTEKAPSEWRTFTIDLWKGNGEFVLTGMAFTVMDGEASYDRIELLRALP